MQNRNLRICIAALVASLGCGIVMRASMSRAEPTSAGVRAEAAEDKRWEAVAPGRIEPVSGEIKLTPSVMGPIGEVLVKANDKVFAGEPLIHLIDEEARTRVATAEAQVALRRRTRNDESASGRATTRRKAEDALADAEKSLYGAQATVDRIAIERRAGRASEADLNAARAALARAQDLLKQHKAELRRVEADTGTPLPSQAEGQLNIARSELRAAMAALDKLTLRAPIAGTVLQVNAKIGELAGPTSTSPLVLLGDTSALRVRAELDDHDFGEVNVGQAVEIRADAFRDRQFAGKVSFIAPLVEAGRINARGGQRNLTDVDVVEVLVDLADPGPLAVGMKVDVYFRPKATR